MTAAYARLPLNALRVFEAVATRLNFSEAAEALHVTPAAVSQHIRSLEEYLQVPLFTRRGRRVQLTAEGIELLPSVRRGLGELAASLQQSKDRRFQVGPGRPRLNDVVEVEIVRVERDVLETIPISTEVLRPQRFATGRPVVRQIDMDFGQMIVVHRVSVAS